MRKRRRKKMEQFNSDITLMAQWCVDSETGRRVLVDSHSGIILAYKDSNGNIVDTVFECYFCKQDKPEGEFASDGDFICADCLEEFYEGMED
jgi:hypothetical protein